eukprot:953010-Pyramimonas_sp.AAC.1
MWCSAPVAWARHLRVASSLRSPKPASEMRSSGHPLAGFLLTTCPPQRTVAGLLPVAAAGLRFGALP